MLLIELIQRVPILIPIQSRDSKLSTPPTIHHQSTETNHFHPESIPKSYAVDVKLKNICI